MNKVLDIISRIVCVILCVLLFVFLFGYLTLNTFTKIVNTKNVTSIVTSLESKTLLGEDFINSLYDDAQQNGIDKSIIDGIVESKEFKELTGKMVGNILECTLYGKDVEIITSNEVVNLIEAHIDKIASDLGIVLTAEDKNIILQEVRNESEKIVGEISIEEEIKSELTKEELNTIHFVFGGALQTVLLIVIFILIAIIALCRWSIYRFAAWTGATTLIVGGVFVLLSLGISNILAMQTDIQITQDLLGVLDKNVLGIITNVGIVVLIIGGAQLVYYFVMKKVRSA